MTVPIMLFCDTRAYACWGGSYAHSFAYWRVAVLKASPLTRYNLAKHVYARCVEPIESP